jgi:hypothetical protein
MNAGQEAMTISYETIGPGMEAMATSDGTMTLGMETITKWDETMKPTPQTMCMRDEAMTARDKTMANLAGFFVLPCPSGLIENLAGARIRSPLNTCGDDNPLLLVIPQCSCGESYTGLA